jgi:chemotaxis protein methyltransferase CheR
VSPPHIAAYLVSYQLNKPIDGTCQLELNKMQDDECVIFLQWALPRLDLAWPGFRKVRGQVCKRIKRRIRRLGIANFADYRARLEADPEEWPVLDGFCRITISRFWRDQSTFDVLRQVVLPEIAMRAAAERRNARIWSAGCASGEEPYTLKILWDLEISLKLPDVSLGIIATDLDEALLDRARRACYPAASLRELSPELAAQAFSEDNGCWCLRPAHRRGVQFLRQDVRKEAPPGRFDLVLCRNLAFTYFAFALQEAVLERIRASLKPGGFLVIGSHEHLPGSNAGWSPFGDSRTHFVVVA